MAMYWNFNIYGSFFVLLGMVDLGYIRDEILQF